MGDLLEWEHWIRPGGHVGRDHIHPVQVERFEVIEGSVRVRIGRDHRRLSAGDVVEVAPGTPHGLVNDTSDEVRIRIELRPALKTEEFFERVFALAASGKVNRKGVPNPLRAAVILEDSPDTVRVPGLPVRLQKVGIAMLARVARLVGVT